MYINNFPGARFRQFTFLRVFSRARRSSIYNVLIALLAAVRCYTIIWLNQSLPLIRSSISGGNYWNGCLSWKYLEWRFVLPKGLLNFVWWYCNFGCLTYVGVSLNHCATYAFADTNQFYQEIVNRWWDKFWRINTNVMENGIEIPDEYYPSVISVGINLFIKSFLVISSTPWQEIFILVINIRYIDLRVLSTESILYRKILFHGNICNVRLRQCYICWHYDIEIIPGAKE